MGRSFSKTHARGQSTPLAPPKRKAPTESFTVDTVDTVDTATTAATAATTPNVQTSTEGQPATTAAPVPEASQSLQPPQCKAPRFEVVGNFKVWQTVLETLRRGSSQCLLLRGPPGVGKTVGAEEAIRFCGRRCVFVHCAELAATDRNRAELCAELHVSATRRGCDDADDGRPPVLVLDDLDTLPQPLVAQMVTFLASPPTCVLATCGRTMPPWLGRATGRAAQKPGHLPAVQLHLRPLMETELRSVGRLRFKAQFKAPLPESREVVDGCARASNGDARRFLNELRLAAPGVKVHSVAPQLHEWAAASRLLHTRVDHVEVDGLVEGQKQPLLAALLHANYLDAVLAGREASFGDEGVAADVCRCADLFSEADVMRSGPTATTLRQGTHLTACVALGVGSKLDVAPHLRHSLPPARDGPPPSEELWAIPGRLVRPRGVL